MQTPPPPLSHLDPAGDIPSDAWAQVQDAHELCEALELVGRKVRFRRDSPRPWAEMTSGDGSMTVALRPSDIVNPARLAELAARSGASPTARRRATARSSCPPRR